MPSNPFAKMDASQILVLVIIGMTVFLFITEWLSIDLVAMLGLGALLLTGILTPEEGFKGFGNEAVVTIAAMFVISAALVNTGIVNSVGSYIARLFELNFLAGLVIMMVVIAFISAFINNTPVVAVFIPILLKAGTTTKVHPSRLLMSLSYASLFGGVCTLIGTSTNLLVSGLAEQYGAESFSMFEMTRLGIVFLIVGIAYMVLVGFRLIPQRKMPEDLAEEYRIRDYLTEIVILAESPMDGLAISESSLTKDMDLNIIEVRRKGTPYFNPPPWFKLKANDQLKVSSDVEMIKDLKEQAGIAFKTDLDLKNEEETEDIKLVEVAVSYNSYLEGKTLKESLFRRGFDAIVLAIRHREEIKHSRLSKIQLHAGDVLLLEVKAERLVQLRKAATEPQSSFVILSETWVDQYNLRRLGIVLPVIIGMVALAAFSILPIAVGAVCGALLLVVTRCISMRDVYQAIDWKVIFLLAGAISLGIAMEKTGVAELIATFLISTLGHLGPVAVVSGLYITTSLLTETMSNNAAAALLTPIAIVTAQAMDVQPLPLIMAIAFAASASFMTPVGYQTNTMIYSAGQYKYRDFLIVGTPLNLIFWLLATLLIPVFYPFS